MCPCHLVFERDLGSVNPQIIALAKRTKCPLKGFRMTRPHTCKCLREDRQICKHKTDNNNNKLQRHQVRSETEKGGISPINPLHLCLCCVQCCCFVILGSGVLMWHLQRNAWDVVALCVFVSTFLFSLFLFSALCLLSVLSLFLLLSCLSPFHWFSECRHECSLCLYLGCYLVTLHESVFHAATPIILTSLDCIEQKLYFINFLTKKMLNLYCLNLKGQN